MAIDKILLQVIKYREEYDRYRHMIRDHLVDDTTLTLVRDFKAYFDKYEDHLVINFEIFENWFKQFKHPNMKKADLEYYQKVFEQIEQDADPKLASTLVQDMRTLNFGTIITNKSQDMMDGKITGETLVADVTEELDTVLELMAQSKDVVWDTDSLAEVVDSTSYDTGLHFRLSCLDESVGALHGSKFAIVGAYVDTGKSTFLADQFGAGFIEQIVNNQDMWYANRPIIWFNNEGASKEIKMYFYQSLFGVEVELIRNHPEHSEKRLMQETNGQDLFRVVPCQGWSIHDAEQVIKTYKPCVVIYDMLDNFKGFEQEKRGDERFQKLYDKARQMTEKYDHVGVATSQCTGEAEGLEHIPMSYLAGSRVAKQSTADLIITIGRSIMAGKQNSRYIHTPKNKLQAQKSKNFHRGTNTEVRFNGDIKRFEDPIVDADDAEM